MGLIAPLQNAAARYPLRVAVALQLSILGLFAWSLATYGVFDATDASGQPSIDYIVSSLTLEAIAATIMLVIIGVIGWGKACRLTTAPDPAGLKWALPLNGVLAFIALSTATLILTDGTAPDRGLVLLQLLLFSIAVGVFEETLYRGTLFHGLRQYLPPFWAMIVSSAVFGIFHMQNVAAGQAIDATLFQSLNAFALGVLFCAIMLQTNSIWWAIALHALWDMFLFFGAYLAELETDVGETTEIATGGIPAQAFLLPLTLLLLGLLCYRGWATRRHA